MKRFFFIFLFIQSVKVFSQGEYKLILRSDDKSTKHGFSYWSEVKVQSKDTSFYYLLHSADPDEIYLNQPGSYTITCSSVFGDKVTKKVNVKKKTTKVKFTGMQKKYKSPPQTINLSERLKKGDTLFIIYSTGYPAISYEKLGVTKTERGYEALQFQGLTTDIFQTMQITEKQFKEVIKFEMMSKELKSSPTCMLPEYYTLELNTETYSFNDASCSWNGFNNLKGILLMIEK